MQLIQFTFQMKVKKQIRWLVFLLTPFVILFVLLFLVPLEFLVNSHPILQQSYNNQKIKLQQNSIRSLAMVNNGIVTTKMQGFQNFLNLLIRLLQPSPVNFMNITTQNIQLNNMYLFSQKIINQNLSLTYQQPLSMWFATNAQTVADLNPAQLAILQSYKLLQPIIESQFLLGLNLPKGLNGITIVINSSNTSMYFQYPSKYRPAYTNLSASPLTTYYNQTTQNYYKSNKTVFYSSFTINQVLSICSVLGSDTPFGVACLNIDIKVFGDELTSSLALVKGSYTSTKYSLFTPIYPTYADTYGPNNTFPINLMSFDSSNISSINYTNSFYNNHPELSKSLWTPTYGENLTRLFVNRQNNETLYQTPIIIKDVNSKLHLILYLMLQNDFLASSLDTSKSSQEILNTLLIPTVILIFISIALSIFLLNLLLNKLDTEITKLNEKCQCIIKEELDLEIPEYKKTEDIVEVYEQIKIINKLHKYTNPQFFKGHFATKILKYNDALCTIKSLGYDQGCLLENMGECFLYIDQFDKAFSYLGDSIELVLSQIKNHFGSLETVYEDKKLLRKIPQKCKDLQQILIRRLWKTIYAHFKYLYMAITRPKDNQESEDCQQKNGKNQKTLIQQNMHKYFGLFRKAIYPEYGRYAESIFVWGFQAKYYIVKKNYLQASECLQKGFKFLQTFEGQYEEITEKLKQGDSNKNLFTKYKLTAHSRTNPSILKSFLLSIKSELLLNEPFLCKRYYQAFSTLCLAIKSQYFSQSFQYLNIFQMVRQLKVAGIDYKKFETTQIYRQSMPLKTLRYEEEINENQQLQFCNINSTGFERQFVFVFDSSKSKLSTKISEKYLSEKIEDIFERIIKNKDRISIIKCNSDVHLETICNLTIKESNELIIKSQLKKVTKRDSNAGKSTVSEVFHKIIQRISKLESEKIVIVCLKEIQSYEAQQIKLTRRFKKRKSDMLKERTFTEPHLIEGDDTQGRSETIGTIPLNEQLQEFPMLNCLGRELLLALTRRELRNCKVILLGALNDEIHKIRTFFDLHDINERIWKETGGLNINNNVVYVVGSKHKNDLNRILLSKFSNVPDNHVFIL